MNAALARLSRCSWLTGCSLTVFLVASDAVAQGSGGTNSLAPFSFLIGEWNVSGDGGEPGFVQRFRWGPKQSYIWAAVSVVQAGEEVPHFEGILVWNARRNELEMLFALGLDGPGALERGSVSIDANGVVIREITSVSARGEERFRQTFKADGPNRVITALIRKTKNGWEPTFQGSDRLIMVRRDGRR